VPSLILSGVQDGVTPPSEHHIPMYNALASSCKTILNVIGGGHCYFANSNFNCDFGESTSSSGISISRAQQQDVFNDFVGSWLDFTLKSNCASFDIFQDSVSSSSRVTYSQQCNYSTPIINVTLSQTSTTITSLESTVGATYQWINCFDNSEILGATNQSYSPTMNGNYAVIITVNGCSSTSDCVAFTTTNLGVNDEALLNLSLSPNPTKDMLQVVFLSAESMTYTIIDSQGKYIKASTINSGENISMNELTNGVYFIKFDSEYTTITKRIIKY